MTRHVCGLLSIEIATVLCLITLACGRPPGGVSNEEIYTPKMPLTEAEALKVTMTDDAIEVSGQTFSYTFDETNGLIKRIKVLDDVYLDSYRGCVPDMWITDARNPSKSMYLARLGRETSIKLKRNKPERVVIEARGGFLRSDGREFPVEHRIQYQIDIDGVMFVSVTTRAKEQTSVRWLCLSRAELPAELVSHFGHRSDQALDQWSGEHFFETAPKSDSLMVRGLFIPWLWFGNPRTGVEVVTWNADNQRYGEAETTGGMVDSLGIGRPRDMYTARRDGDKVIWENFIFRNAATIVPSGWEQTNRFSIAVTPPKPYDPAYSTLRQGNENQGHTDEQLRLLATEGCNLVSGMSVPRELSQFTTESIMEINREIDRYHTHGIPIIPYLTFMDHRENLPIFKEHGYDWAIEPMVEFRYRQVLLCPGAAGYRRAWKKMVTRVVDEFNFDGIKFDLWYGKLACENERHGCGGRFRRATYPFFRDMLAHAYNTIKGKDPRNIVRVNTNVMSMSMVNSLVDNRLVGEAGDISRVSDLSMLGFYFSYRLGCNTTATCRRGPWSLDRLTAFWLLNMAPFRRITSWGIPDITSPEEKADLDRTWNILRFARVSSGEWFPALSGSNWVTTGDEHLYVNAHRCPDGLLLTAVNWSDTDRDVPIRINEAEVLGLNSGSRYLVYEPRYGNFALNGARSMNQLREFSIKVPAYGYRVLWVRELPDNPDAIYILGADGLESAEWSEAQKALTIVPIGPETAELNVTAFTGGQRPKWVETSDRGRPGFKYDHASNLVHFSVINHKGLKIIVKF